MVAIRKKVGARGYLRSKPMAKGKRVVKIDCTVPVADDIFDTETVGAFEQYMQQNIKLHGKKGKLGDKVKVAMKKNTLEIQTVMRYNKRYFKYLTKKFLKKKELRDWLRILATGKNAFTLKYYNIHDQEEEE